MVLAPFFRGEPDQMPQPISLARDARETATLCQAPDTALVAPAAGSTHPTSGSAQGMAVEALHCAKRMSPCVSLAPRCKSVLVARSFDRFTRHTQSFNLYALLTLPFGQTLAMADLKYSAEPEMRTRVSNLVSSVYMYGGNPAAAR